MALADKGIACLIPYLNPWNWMNRQAVAYTDELIAVLCAVPVVLIVFAVTAVRKKKQAAHAEAGGQTSGDDRSDPE